MLWNMCDQYTNVNFKVLNKIMKKKLIIINKAQFGYHTDSLKYCQHLKNDYNITYVCFDTGREKLYEDNVEVVYVPYEGSFLKRGLGFVKFCRNRIKIANPDLVFVVYFQMASLVRLGLSRDNFILDIRTGAIGTTPLKRKIDDTLMALESRAYKQVTIITECLRDKLKLKEKKCHILPLGADELSKTDKNFDTIKLLYVGTFLSRNMHETIFGLSKFMKEISSENINISYDIFGFGTHDEEELVKNAIKSESLENIVTYHGRKQHHEIQDYFDNCNIGITYVPKVDFFECQPPTKIFEYTNSGMFNLATSTFENKKLIFKENGVLCEDNNESFSKSLSEIYNKKDTFNSKEIRKTLELYSWDNIIHKNLKKYLESIT